MPQCCVVPFCSDRRSGHRFPKNPTHRKAWFIAIKREKFVPTEHSRVCNKHFAKTDFVLPKDSVAENPKPRLKDGGTPSIFSWSGDTSISSQRAERLKRRGGVKKLAQSQLVQPEEGISDTPEPDFVFEDQPSSATKDHEDQTVIEDPLYFQSEVTVTDNSAGISTSCEENNSVSEGNSDCHACSNDIETTNSDFGGRLMRIQNFKGDKAKEQLQFYTGFDSFEHFMFVFNLLGPADNHLNYYSEYSTKRGSGVKKVVTCGSGFLDLD